MSQSEPCLLAVSRATKHWHSSGDLWLDSLAQTLYYIPMDCPSGEPYLHVVWLEPHSSTYFESCFTSRQLLYFLYLIVISGCSWVQYFLFYRAWKDLKSQFEYFVGSRIIRTDPEDSEHDY